MTKTEIIHQLSEIERVIARKERSIPTWQKRLSDAQTMLASEQSELTRLRSLRAGLQARITVA